MKKLFYIVLILASQNALTQEVVDLDHQFLKQVGIDSEAFKRYENLIGTKGLVEKNIIDDPVIVLGMYAENDHERKKYAKLYLDREVKRANRMMKFINVYYEVFDEEIGSKPLLDLSPFQKQTQHLNFSDNRLIAFYSIDCKSCIRFSSNLQTLVKKQKVKGVDIYFTGYGSTDEINKWAKEANIDIGLVNQKLITLNEGESLAKEIGVVEESKLFVRKGEALQELKITDLLGLY